MEQESLHRTMHSELPESNFYVWDGRRERPMYKESRENYKSYVPDMDEIDVVGLKFGTGVISHGLMERTRKVISCIADEVNYLLRNPGKSRKVFITTSGAIRQGEKIIQMNQKYYRDLKMKDYTDSDRKRLYAGIGQPGLMNLYQQYFGELGIIVSQSIVTHTDFEDDKTRSELIAKYMQYMEDGFVPIINEDDLRSPEEIEDNDNIFRDNDGLHALVTTCLADTDDYRDRIMSVVLTDQRGIRPKSYFSDGRSQETEERVIRVVLDPTGLESEVAEKDGETKGRGWAWSKIEAHRKMASSGIHGIVASGGYDRPDRDSHHFRPITAAADGLCVGTRFIVPERYKGFSVV